MIHLKGCQRCNGDVVENSDHEGEYMECLQCGHVTYSGKPAENPNAKDGWRKKERKEYCH